MRCDGQPSRATRRSQGDRADQAQPRARFEREAHEHLPRISSRSPQPLLGRHRIAAARRRDTRRSVVALLKHERRGVVSERARHSRARDARARRTHRVHHPGVHALTCARSTWDPVDMGPREDTRVRIARLSGLGCFRQTRETCLPRPRRPQHPRGRLQPPAPVAPIRIPSQTGVH